MPLEHETRLAEQVPWRLPKMVGLAISDCCKGLARVGTEASTAARAMVEVDSICKTG